MKTGNIVELKASFSKLLKVVEDVEPFGIARAGVPDAQVMPYSETPIERSDKPMKRIGFLEGQFEVPDDIDTMFKNEIGGMFYGDSPPLLEPRNG